MSEKPLERNLIKIFLEKSESGNGSLNRFQIHSDSMVWHTWLSEIYYTSTKNKEKTFIELGFTNWKKVTERFCVHTPSAMHLHGQEPLLRPSHSNEILSQTAAALKS